MKRAPAGFTLLEVLAAIVVMALAFTMLLKAMGASLALTHKAGERTEVAAMAQSLLDGAFVMTPPQPGVTRGRFDDAHRWRLEVTRWQAPAATRRAEPAEGEDGATAGAMPLPLYKLDLRVTWGPPARQRNAHFSTLRVAAPARGEAP